RGLLTRLQKPPAPLDRGSTVGMAERQGFEPWLEFPLNTLSKRAPSATRPSLRASCFPSLTQVAQRFVPHAGRIVSLRAHDHVRSGLAPIVVAGVLNAPGFAGLRIEHVRHAAARVGIA